jgi:putative endonuclease
VPSEHYVYILRCSDGSYYVGSTCNLEERLRAHNEGRAATHTSEHRPVCLVYSEALPTEEEAIRRERQIKGWSRSKKEALISGDLERLKVLSKGR